MSALEKIAIVTGTSAGIGAAVVRELIDDRWRVIGISRRSASFGDAYTHLSTDLGDVPLATSAIESIVRPILADKSWTRIGLVNNAASADLLAIGESADPSALARVYAVNTVIPIWLMGFVARNRRGDVPLRIVNVSSGAGRSATPGLLAYGSSKAALRIAGMTLVAEWESNVRYAPRRANVAVRSYEPGVVDTDMQNFARSLPPEKFPWNGLFRDFYQREMLVEPARPAREIVAFLANDGDVGFSDARLGP
jgi:NAD(P)-dependent dehydrogenase (short-subunit alcohol dehydrogenase family)